MYIHVYTVHTCIYMYTVHMHVLQITKFELACLSGWMYCICVSLFALHVSLFALPCLHYLKFEPSQLGCLGSSVGRALD